MPSTKDYAMNASSGEIGAAFVTPERWSAVGYEFQDLRRHAGDGHSCNIR
jgi:hypothetical protein